MVASAAVLQRRLADLNRQTRVVYRRLEERATSPTEPARRSALDLAAELGVTLDPWQVDALTTERHDILLLVTRQGGKGEVATFLALDQLVNVTGSTTVVIAPSERQSKRLLRRIKRRYRQLSTALDPVTDNVFEFGLRNGAEVLALPGSEATIRGIDAVDLLIVDEAILVSDILFNSVYPMLAVTDGRCVAMSTARPVHNWFWRAYVDTDDDWHRAKITWEDIPRFKKNWIERTRRRLGERTFAQEFACEFLPEDAVFRRVAEAATAEPQDAPIPRHAYLVSVDWAKHQDFTVIVTWDATLGHLVGLDRFQQIDYTLQLGRLQAICERFRPFALIPERNSIGDVLIEQIARQPWSPPTILPFTTTNASKAVAVEAFALALEQEAVKIVDDPVLIGELQAFEAERLPSGMLRYRAPEGMHDDCVIAAIIGWHAIAGVGPTDEVIVVDEPVVVSPY